MRSINFDGFFFEKMETLSVQDPLNMHRTASNETTVVSEIPNMINDENVIVAPGQGRKQFQF